MSYSLFICIQLITIVIRPERTFNSPLDPTKLKLMAKKSFAPETFKKINWAVTMYRKWRIHRNDCFNDTGEFIFCNLDDDSSITQENFIFAMCRFITEVKKVSGEDFPAKTLYDIVICVQFHLETLGLSWHLLNDDQFKEVKFTLDNLMKERTEMGLGLRTKRAYVLSHNDEELLWSLGIVGTSNPEQLFNAVFLSIGLSFAMRAGKEHKVLRGVGFNAQISFHYDDDGQMFMRYTEDIGLKTNKGGIKNRKTEPKVVDVYHIENHERCPVCIVLKYCSLVPESRVCDAFYLQPVKKAIGFVIDLLVSISCNLL